MRCERWLLSGGPGLGELAGGEVAVGAHRTPRRGHLAQLHHRATPRRPRRGATRRAAQHGIDRLDIDFEDTVVTLPGIQHLEAVYPEQHRSTSSTVVVSLLSSLKHRSGCETTTTYRWTPHHTNPPRGTSESRELNAGRCLSRGVRTDRSREGQGRTGMGTRMKTVAVAAAVSMLLFGGCGSKDGSGSQSSGGTVSPAKLSSALLTISDMPTGWSEETGETTTSTESSSDGGSSSFKRVLCPESAAALPDSFKDLGKADSSATSSAWVEFSKSSMGPFLMQGAVSGSGSADKRFDTIKSALEGCKGKTWDDTDKEGVKTTYSLAPASAPKLGDRSFAYRITGDASMGELTFDLIMGQKGDVLITLISVSLISPFGRESISADEMNQIVDTANRKLSEF